MDSLNMGVILLDKDGIIRMCNRRAEEITGISISAGESHPAGKIEDGDIVIIADSKMGEDDGNLSTEDLKMLNIKDGEIREGDVIIAMGVYKNEKVRPIYKAMREHQLSTPMTVEAVYYGFRIFVSVDTVKHETLISVNDKKYRMGYFSAVGNMVVIDGATGEIKFFQARGYSVRNEDAGGLLRGKPYMEKEAGYSRIEVTGRNYFDVFDDSAVASELFAVLDGRSDGFLERIYEINKRPFICSVVPCHGMGECPENGVYLILEAAENLERLLSDRNEIIHQLEQKASENEVEHTGDFPEEPFENFAGVSSQIREVKYMAYKASRSKFNVIITGESGTGKSMLARDIHNAGTPGAPFIEVNCNAIAPSLFESELFGYVGGAFTGARAEGKIGFFEAADKGTIFLDEIGDIPMDIQVKLLHVLQDKIIYRVGSSKPVKIDVRVIAATNRNLEEEVAAGRFRQDLFYRINVFPIEIPPIRDRKSDLYILITKLMKRICETYGMEMKQFSGGALRKLLSYDWPGNVRELENVIERAVTICDSNIIYIEHLRIGRQNEPVTMKEYLAMEEARVLETALLKYHGDKHKAMEELDMSKSVFYDKLKKYGIKY